jgi:hypothetical protein
MNGDDLSCGASESLCEEVLLVLMTTNILCPSTLRVLLLGQLG